MKQYIIKIKEKANTIRPSKKTSAKHAITTTACVLALGIILGVFSKWLDNLELDSTIWWHRTAEKLDLGNFFSDMAVWLLLALIIAAFSRSALRAAVNVFAFFAGMCAAYHLYTVLFSGFNPSSYMMIWYAITAVSPVLAAVTWYSRGNGVVPVILDVGIVAVFALSCFGMGWLYVSFRGVLYLLTFVGAVAVIYKRPFQFLISLPAGFALAFLLSPLWPLQ